MLKSDPAKLYLSGLATLLSAGSALADAIQFGVASRCNQEHAVFEIVGMVEANGVIAFATSAPEDFTPLAVGPRALSCKLPGGTLKHHSGYSSRPTASARVLALQASTACRLAQSVCRSAAPASSSTGPAATDQWSCDSP